MNLFQIILVVMSTLIVVVWIYMISKMMGDIRKLKKEDKRANKEIKKEDYVDLFTKLKDKDKIYITDQGTILNSKPHTFKDFIDNQRLPSKLELTWEILSENNLKVSDIIKLIESNASYPMDTKVGTSINYLKVTLQQTKMIKTLNMYDNPIKIDDNYPLYIIFSSMTNYYGKDITVIYQAGYDYDDKNLDRGAPTKPTKY